MSLAAKKAENEANSERENEANSTRAGKDEYDDQRDEWGRARGATPAARSDAGMSLRSKDTENEANSERENEANSGRAGKDEYDDQRGEWGRAVVATPAAR